MEYNLLCYISEVTQESTTSMTAITVKEGLRFIRTTTVVVVTGDPGHPLTTPNTSTMATLASLLSTLHVLGARGYMPLTHPLDRCLTEPHILGAATVQSGSRRIGLTVQTGLPRTGLTDHLTLIKPPLPYPVSQFSAQRLVSVCDLHIVIESTTWDL